MCSDTIQKSHSRRLIELARVTTLNWYNASGRVEHRVLHHNWLKISRPTRGTSPK